MESVSSEDWLEESLQVPQHQGHQQISEVEYTRLAEQFHTTGYREGIHKGKELAIQEGFNHGFAAGAQRGKRLGSLRGRASATLNLLLKQMEEDARVDRVRKLIRDLNQYGIVQDPNQSSRANELEDLTSRMDGLMTPSNPTQPQSVTTQYQKEQDDQLLDRCQFELDAILASMNIWLPGL
ncbi:hypothetical protein PGT21_026189 [Puccinia graminis f. sp. tritici]|uniref:Protein YAE1 n=1 Tax=Puccinia graminis f. sp. tritici TaxID=56615 RepID=A0A5B0P8Z7_PUCGR|nr:hypothetical protein PGT21_027333 [Puccinia graminis f. sp. tritici]KAA1101623.1 hypothetical protein PGT21_026189 [Puccinia graminis f. sp. tritici]KAA1116988.1 hypothetical protein PGTUg99_033259 [Puccinia graminis f. sp. tritici]KAA1136345.1 hypothetical protein PGTUg99_026493 [Puccinia graminis f. sp. tritici]